MYDNDFRDLQNFVEGKLKHDIKVNQEENATKAPDYHKI